MRYVSDKLANFLCFYAYVFSNISYLSLVNDSYYLVLPRIMLTTLTAFNFLTTNIMQRLSLFALFLLFVFATFLPLECY